MVRQHQRLNGHGFEQILGDSGGQRRLVCYSLGGHKKVGDDLVTEQQQTIPTFNLVKMYTLQLLRLPTKMRL